MKNGKNFNIYLMDGEVTGRIKCTLSNWTGIAYKIPRLYLDKCKDRLDLKQSGVYFLFGKNDEDEESVYIGQAGIRKNGEGVLFRVQEHIKDEFFFSEAVMLTTQNNSFGPTEISYLENKFTNMAIDTDRYKVRNGNDPNPGNVTEEKESVDTAGCYRSSCVVNGLVKLFYVRCNQCGISDTAGNRTDRINYGRVKQQSTKANKKEKFLKSEISP